MEKVNFVKRLPPGFRFHPTDEELVVQYLNRKAFSLPLPASIIPEADVCKFDPWDLPGDKEQDMYFFSAKEAKYRNGNRSNRATGSGYWKATGIDKKIVASTTNRVIGMKKTLVFYRGKAPSGSRTDWIMHEYRLANAETSASQNGSSNQSPEVVKENWVLCRIFLKKRSNRNEENNMKSYNGNGTKRPRMSRLVFYDFMKEERAMLNVAPSSSSSGSSGVTEISSNEPDDHEENSPRQ